MMLNVILIDQAINVKCSSRDRPDYLFKKNTPEIIVRIFPTPSIRSFRRNKPRSKKKKRKENKGQAAPFPPSRDNNIPMETMERGVVFRDPLIKPSGALESTGVP